MKMLRDAHHLAWGWKGCPGQNATNFAVKTSFRVALQEKSDIFS